MVTWNPVSFSINGRLPKSRLEISTRDSLVEKFQTELKLLGVTA